MMGDSTYRSTLDCFTKTLKNDVWNPFPVFFLISCVYCSILLQIFFHLFKIKKSNGLNNRSKKENRRKVPMIYSASTFRVHMVLNIDTLTELA